MPDIRPWVSLDAQHSSNVAVDAFVGLNLYSRPVTTDIDLKHIFNYTSAARGSADFDSTLYAGYWPSSTTSSSQKVDIDDNRSRMRTYGETSYRKAVYLETYK